MCIKNVVRRSGAFLSALVLCFALTLPALADETLLTGDATLTLTTHRPSYSSWDYTEQVISSGASAAEYRFTTGSYSVESFGWSIINLSSLIPSDGEIGIYFSSYYRSAEAFTQNKVPAASDFSLRYSLTSTQAGLSSSVSSVSLFEPVSDYASVSDGITIVAHVTNSVSDPISDLILYNGTVSSSPAWFVNSISGDPFFTNQAGRLYVTSFRVVSTSSSAELDSLENMASAIAEQSEVLSQFYGDIVAVCNQIYQRLGDLQAAQEEANALFSSVISTLNTTNSKLTSINTAMSTYFELVLKSLANESLSIQDCIDDAEARLELYLKPMIDYFTELEEQTGESAATLPQHKTDLDSFSSTDAGIDADAQTGLAAILPILGAFSFIFQILGIFIGLGILNIIIRKGLS